MCVEVRGRSQSVLHYCVTYEIIPVVVGGGGGAAHPRPSRAARRTRVTRELLLAAGVCECRCFFFFSSKSPPYIG